MSATTTASPVTDADQQMLEALDRPKPNGPAFAALLSAGLGSAALGLFTTLAEASSAFNAAMDISKNVGALPKGVGPLSGKTTYAVLVYLVSWAILAYVMRGKHYPERPLFIATFVLIGIGVLGTFPIFFELFAP